MTGMSKSKIGYCGTGADGREITEYYGWNPGGFGCSGGCDGCWSRAMSRRAKCPDCRAFKVHLHPERLGQPAATKLPGMVLCNFTNNWLDPQRDMGAAHQMMCAAAEATRHVYISLTKEAKRLALLMSHRVSIETWYHGLTLRSQDEADEKLPTFLTIPGNLWLSLEPLWGPVDLRLGDDISETGCSRAECLRGIIVGHDNRGDAPGTETLEHVRSVVRQCRAAGVPVYVKQLWLPGCPKCKTTHEPGDMRCAMDTCGRILRRRLFTDLEAFPIGLERRDLPWSMPTKGPWVWTSS